MRLQFVYSLSPQRGEIHEGAPWKTYHSHQSQLLSRIHDRRGPGHEYSNHEELISGVDMKLVVYIMQIILCSG